MNILPYSFILFILVMFIAISYNYNNNKIWRRKNQVPDECLSNVTKRKRIVICRHIAASSHDASSDAALHVSHGGGSRRWSSPGFRTASAATDPPPLALAFAFASHDESSGAAAGRDDERDGESDIHRVIFVPLGTSTFSPVCPQLGLLRTVV